MKEKISKKVIDRETKQVIVIRKDLNMRKGKMVAQGAHASFVAIFNSMKWHPLDNTLFINLWEYKDIDRWTKTGFKKICVSVNSESELLEIFNKAKNAGLVSALITDAGLTEFDGVPTKTCCAIGPAFSDEVDKITGHLKLL